MKGAGRGCLYVETSAVLRILLEGDRLLAARIGRAARLATSSLTAVEARRGLRRALHEGRIDQRAFREGERWLHRFLRSCDEIALAPEVLGKAGDEFPVEPVRTLDGLHLASALVWEQEIGTVTLASCDDRVRDNGEALGWKVLPA
jgi:hypothetical protein